jgi:type IV pilus assembly protein PilM
MANELKRPGVWGIDLGLCALKAIRLEVEDGEIKATAFDYIEHPKILSQPDADPDELTREALEKFLSRNDLKGDQIAIGVPGLNGLARFVKLPPVDEKKIPDIVRFEAKQQIPFPLHEVVWGFQRLGSGSKNDNMVMDAEIGLFAMKRDMINKSLQQFKDMGVEVHVIQMAPLALCNFLAHDRLGKGAERAEEEDKEKTCIVGLDIGVDNSNLVITDGERIIWQRPIPLGGNHFTRALTKELKLTFAKAEHVKRNAVKSPDLKKILAALKPVLNDFVSEVQRSLGYFTNTHRDATIKYMLGMGNAFRLPGLQRYLQEKLQLEVHKLQKIERLGGEDTVTEAPQFVENLLSFGVAHGLALQGLNNTRIYTNLLPPEIAQERAIRRKKPWVVAAAAVLLLLTPPLLLGYSVALGTWTSDSVKKANDQLEKVVKDGDREVQEFSDSEKEVDQTKKKLQELAGGVNERLNWARLNDYINEALPQPDGSHLAKLARDGSRPYVNYFNNKGQDAYLRWPLLQAKLAAGATLTDKEKQEEEEIKKHLVKINLEAVSALYSDAVSKEFGIFMKGATLPLTGWIVEIRGYTYHEKTDLFVLQTLIENLMELADGDPKNPRLPDVKLHPATKSVLRGKDSNGAENSRVSAAVILSNYPDEYPMPGMFKLISASQSAGKLNIYEATTAASTKTKEIKTAAGGSVKLQVPTRLSWRPPKDTVIGTSFGLPPPGGGAGLPRPGAVIMLAPPPGTVVQPLARAMRYEFSVVFIWQEPLTGQ